MSLRIVIVGGVAGGATAAAKARRTNEHAEITVFERGAHISFANCGLPYYIGGEIQERHHLLLSTPEAFAARYRVDVKVNHEVLAIDRSRRCVNVRTSAGECFDQPYDRLILAQGAEPIVPPLPGVELPHVFTLRNLVDMDLISEALKRGHMRRAVVVGGGFIGLEMAEAFHRRGLEVDVIERAPHILPRLEAELAAELQSGLCDSRFSLHCGRSLVSIEADHVTLDDGTILAADLVLLSAGVRPENRIACEAGLALGVTGGTLTNGRMQTSDPFIYAVGDMAEVRNYITGAPLRLPLAGPANRQGRIAGANAAGAHKTYTGALGTSIVRIMQQVVAMVGLNLHEARSAGLKTIVSVTRDQHHAGYYPGAQAIVTWLLAEEGTGRLLGAQIIGTEGVDKRIDVLATAMYAGLSVFDLEALDLAYAPPFSGANDPVNVAGFVAARELSGETPCYDPALGLPTTHVLLDVREPHELEQEGMLSGARHIPLNQLRERLDELPRQPLLVYCRKGQRGYLASRILRESGFEEVLNLKGGFLQAKWSNWPMAEQQSLAGCP